MVTPLNKALLAAPNRSEQVEEGGRPPVPLENRQANLDVETVERLGVVKSKKETPGAVLVKNRVERLVHVLTSNGCDVLGESGAQPSLEL